MVEETNISELNPGDRIKMSFLDSTDEVIIDVDSVDVDKSVVASTRALFDISADTSIEVLYKKTNIPTENGLYIMVAAPIMDYKVDYGITGQEILYRLVPHGWQRCDLAWEDLSTPELESILNVNNSILVKI